MPIPTAKLTRSSHHIHVITSTTLRRATKLNSVDFAPFGDVVDRKEGEGKGLWRSVDANQGTATKWLNVTTIHDFYDECESRVEAKVVVNIFSCRPRPLEEREGGKIVFPVNILERHPFTAQMFVPLGVSPTATEDTTVRYLVIVAPTLSNSNETSSSTATSTSASSDLVRKGPGLPDLDNMRAFIATGDQAVTYGAGTWHAPMVVLGEKPIDFVVVQYSNGVGEEDCQEFDVDAGLNLGVDVGDADIAKSKL